MHASHSNVATRIRTSIHEAKGFYMSFDLGSGGEWRHNIFFSDSGQSNHANLIRCFTFHPNVSLGVGGESTGYRLKFQDLQMKDYKGKDGACAPPFKWEVYIHRDLGWATMFQIFTYTKVVVKPGTYNHVILSAKEVHQLSTEVYPCESRDGYSRDEVIFLSSAFRKFANFFLSPCFSV